MSNRGVLQLQKLTVRYSNWGGSSKGTRDFIERILPAFKREFPHIEVAKQHVKYQHPALIGEYVHGRVKEVCVRNDEWPQVLRQAQYLRTEAGFEEKVTRRRHKSMSATYSAQGLWHPSVINTLKTVSLDRSIEPAFKTPAFKTISEEPEP
mmetsp:Transcript_31763/g.38376  ORF Transcript_31763/g.38376 Transcript_31763/m.38376 type:complete len:151 (+) Transcript_31763:226-678(+)|eukprot:CAMPEP_0197853410 /NCGR_PEP_ID=MMETSP1438-20131217/22679_1 /TAXON_ID=1461541 /ORGANISM="Pterosperma sp., Strain CCMP1384" /LENGTH=150 /DNA_ID=CAMNT_0043467815 /DNA_START=218 /DNA_END=670 /DNA_ORIENTATION=-